MSVSIENAPASKFSDWPDCFSCLNGFLKPFLAVLGSNAHFFNDISLQCGLKLVYQFKMYFPVNFQIDRSPFQAPMALKSLFSAVFWVKCQFFNCNSLLSRQYSSSCKFSDCSINLALNKRIMLCYTHAECSVTHACPCPPT